MKWLLNFSSILLFVSAPLMSHGADILNSLDRMDHEIPGCPLNSICSPASGKMIIRWEKMLKTVNSKNKIKKLKSFHKEHGLPIEFLTTQKAKIPLDPVLWNSRCKLHNPKNPHRNVFRAQKFMKKFIKSDHVVLPQVWVYEGKEKTLYHTPYQDHVLFIQNDQLVVLKDYDDFFYQIGIAKDNSFHIKNFPHTTIDKALTKKVKEFKCPDDIDFDERYFAKSYCQRVLDIDTNKLKTIQYTWTCP